MPSEIDNTEGAIRGISCAIMGAYEEGSPNGSGILCSLSFTAQPEVDDICEIIPLNVVLCDVETNEIQGIVINPCLVEIGEVGDKTDSSLPSDEDIGTKTEPPCSISMITDLPHLPEKYRHPDMDTALFDLTEAEKEGKAEEYARKNFIKLKDDSVGVMIRVVKGQEETAVEAVKRYATEYDIWPDPTVMDAVVPIENLIQLAEEESIGSVRLPAEIQY
jgi:hypothetical protein